MLFGCHRERYVVKPRPPNKDGCGRRAGSGDGKGLVIIGGESRIFDVDELCASHKHCDVVSLEQAGRHVDLAGLPPRVDRVLVTVEPAARIRI